MEKSWRKRIEISELSGSQDVDKLELSRSQDITKSELSGSQDMDKSEFLNTNHEVRTDIVYLQELLFSSDPAEWEVYWHHDRIFHWKITIVKHENLSDTVKDINSCKR